jgi:hypothetical protein
MSDFLRDYGFFIVVAIMMFFCHFGHRHGGAGRGHDENSGESDQRH